MDAQQVDLSNCDREPIHVPGAIQAHGVLLSVSEPELRILQVSANAQTLLGAPAAQLVGGELAQLLDPVSLQTLRAALASQELEHANPLSLTAHGQECDAICHRYAGATVIELEPLAGKAPAGAASLRKALATLEARTSIDSLCRAAADALKELTGFDRVMVYRFDEHDNGCVVAETLERGLDSYLGLHYPASDIPAQARALYRRNWLRIIPHVDYVPSPLVPPLRPDTAQPLDLSHSVLRSVSPIHLEYMRNMGLTASMSVSLVVGDRLWGLISCAHHSGPHYLRYETRAACEVIGRLMSLQLAALEEVHRRELQSARSEPLDRLEHAARAGQDALFSLFSESPRLLGLVSAAGVAAVRGDQVEVAGACPPPEAVLQLARALEELPGEVVSTDAVTRVLPQAAAWKDLATGVLSFSLPGQPARRMLWFRPEWVQTVHWAGKPEKVVSVGPEPRLHPRRSFELWKESVRGRSLPWLEDELAAALELRRRVVEVDLAKQVEREQRAVRARDDLVAVVSHDLKNPLGVVQMQCSLLLRGMGGDEESSRRLRASAERIQRSVNRMNALINDLLDLAKIEAGRFQVNATPQDAERIVEEALLVMAPLAEQKGVPIQLRAEATQKVLADADRVYQVLANLLSNAIKFTEAGGQIELRTRALPGEVLFSVIDSGAGIPEAQLPHVFNRYWQARKSDRQGSGLGLFIAKGVVEAHRGRLWAESTAGQGSRFHFTLPTATAG